MKSKTNFSAIIALITLSASLLFLESRRMHNKRDLKKGAKEVIRENEQFNVSNTDFIFFESLSRYLFISLE
jgi:hypothetical protein